MSSPTPPSHSQFTHRHLRRLRAYSPLSPLRVIALVDYDAFYAQCETVRLGLDATQPLAVQQWHAIIALNYAARGYGFKRGAAVEDVRRLCPDIVLQHVATWRKGESSWAYRSDATDPAMMKNDKAALDPYRIESRKSLKIIKEYLPSGPLQRVEKASVDEVFLDLSAQVHSILLQQYPSLAVDDADQDDFLPFPPQGTILDWDSDHLVDFPEDTEKCVQSDWDDVALSIGARIIRDLCKEIFNGLKYTCSAGIAHNKALAKLGAGAKKPNQQTVIRARAVPAFLSTYKMTSIRGLAGLLGAKAEAAFGSSSITDLLAVSQERMVATLGQRDGTHLFRLLRGIDDSEVIPRTEPQSMLTQKTFVPPLADLSEAAPWLRMFAADLVGRLNDLNVELSCSYRPTTLVVHHHIRGRFGPTVSKQCSIPPSIEVHEEAIFDLAMKQLKAAAADATPAWPCLSIGLAVHGLVKAVQRNQRITSFMPVTTPRPHDNDDCADADADAEGPTRKRLKRDFDSAEMRSKTPPSPLRSGAETSQGITDAAPATVADSYLCPTCDQNIPSADVLEHLDWHVALDLQREQS